MRDSDLTKLDHYRIHRNPGRRIEGGWHLDITPEPRLYHIMSAPSRPSVIEGGFLRDFHATDFVSVEPYRID